jgi:undecaprenyl-diphosphatase
MAHSAFDLGLFHLVNGAAGHPWFDELVREVAGNMFPRVVVLAIPYIFLWFAHDDEESRSRLIAGLFGPLLAILIARGVSLLFPFELRPMFDAASGYHMTGDVRGVDLENYSSFPSDTAAYSIAFTLGLWSVNRFASIVLTVLSAILFCISRIYVGVHYPSDIAVGWLIGIACAAVTNLPIMRKAGKYILHLRDYSEPTFYAAGATILYELGETLYNVRRFFHFLHFLR